MFSCDWRNVSPLLQWMGIQNAIKWQPRQGARCWCPGQCLSPTASQLGADFSQKLPYLSRDRENPGSLVNKKMRAPHPKGCLQVLSGPHLKPCPSCPHGYVGLWYSNLFAVRHPLFFPHLPRKHQGSQPPTTSPCYLP